MDNFLVHVGVYSAIILAVVEVAKRVAEVVPGKKDDEIVSVVDGLVRRILDFVAGRSHGKPNDPSLVKRD